MAVAENNRVKSKAADANPNNSVTILTHEWALEVLSVLFVHMVGFHSKEDAGLITAAVAIVHVLETSQLLGPLHAVRLFAKWKAFESEQRARERQNLAPAAQSVPPMLDDTSSTLRTAVRSERAANVYKHLEKACRAMHAHTTAVAFLVVGVRYLYPNNFTIDVRTLLHLCVFHVLVALAYYVCKTGATARKWRAVPFARWRLVHLLLVYMFARLGYQPYASTYNLASVLLEPVLCQLLRYKMAWQYMPLLKKAGAFVPDFDVAHTFQRVPQMRRSNRAK